MITYFLIVVLVLFAVLLWYLTVCLAQLNTRCASLELKLVVYQYAQELIRVEEEGIESKEKALKGQRSYFTGETLQQFCPFAPEWAYDPGDMVAWFNVVDYIVLKGRAVGEIEEVIFQEMKSSVSSRLNKSQRQLRDCVQAGRVKFEEWRMDRETGKWCLHIYKSKGIGGE